MPKILASFLESVSDDEAAEIWTWFEKYHDTRVEIQDVLEKSHFVLAERIKPT
jgi:hypothetical protein